MINPAVLYPALNAAAKSGNVQISDLWVDHGADPSAKTPSPTPGRYEISLLGNALSSANEDVIERVLQYPVDIHERIGDRTPLEWYLAGSKKGNDASIIHMLVRSGADPNQLDRGGRSLLFGNYSRPGAVKPLVDAGVPVNAKDKDGKTALIQLAYNADNVQALLEAGADPRIVANNGDTALKQAIAQHCDKCIALIQAALTK